MDLLADYHVLLASFLTLASLEIVLGIDNIVFIAIVVGHLHKAQRQRARVIGLTLAMALRIIMLFGIVWIIGLREPWLHVLEFEFSGKDLMMLAGGLFLLYKATNGIHEEITDEEKGELKTFKGGFVSTVGQIIVIDLIFSFDSVITAVGLTDHIYVIIAAMGVAMLIMLAASGYISDFIDRHATLKMLALSFIMMIGVFLVAEGLGFHVPKGYIYFAMAFSLGVEVLNMTVRKKRSRVTKN